MFYAPTQPATKCETECKPTRKKSTRYSRLFFLLSASFSSLQSFIRWAKFLQRNWRKRKRIDDEIRRNVFCFVQDGGTTVKMKASASVLNGWKLCKKKHRFLCFEQCSVQCKLCSHCFLIAWLHGVTCDLCFVHITICHCCCFLQVVTEYVGSKHGNSLGCCFRLPHVHDPLSFAISTVLSADCVPSVLLCVRSICCVFCKCLQWNHFSRVSRTYRFDTNESAELKTRQTSSKYKNQHEAVAATNAVPVIRM